MSVTGTGSGSQQRRARRRRARTRPAGGSLSSSTTSLNPGLHVSFVPVCQCVSTTVVVPLSQAGLCTGAGGTTTTVLHWHTETEALLGVLVPVIVGVLVPVIVHRDSSRNLKSTHTQKHGSVLTVSFLRRAGPVCLAGSP